MIRRILARRRAARAVAAYYRAYAVALAADTMGPAPLLVTAETTAEHINTALADGRDVWWAPDGPATTVPVPLPDTWRSVGHTTDPPPAEHRSLDNTLELGVAAVTGDGWDGPDRGRTYR